MAKLLKTDGSESFIYPLDKREGFTLEELYFILECDTIQTVRLGKDYAMILDEESKLKEGAVLNQAATDLYESYTGAKRYFEDMAQRAKTDDSIMFISGEDTGFAPHEIVGHALVCKNSEFL